MYTHSKHTSCPSGMSTLACGLMFTGVCVCVWKGRGGGAASSCHGVCMAARVWQGERVLARSRVESKPASELRERESDRKRECVCVRESVRERVSRESERESEKLYEREKQSERGL